MTQRTDPRSEVREWCLARGLPREMLGAVPTSYLLFGSAIVLRFPGELPSHYERLIGEGWVRTLGLRTALKRRGIITGPHREPALERLYGPEGDVTHVENGIRYTFDPERVMFSPGNQRERIRMGTLDMRGETVVDLFAGIGYFSLPVALGTGAQTVYACEINPVAFRYLTRNITDNRADTMVPLAGDNRMVAPRGVADRVIMGYMGTTHLFLETAFACLRDGGIIHYHETCPLHLFPGATVRRIKNAALTWIRGGGIPGQGDGNTEDGTRGGGREQEGAEGGAWQEGNGADARQEGAGGGPWREVRGHPGPMVGSGAVDTLRTVAPEYPVITRGGWEVRILRLERVKKYGPRTVHVVADIGVSRVP